MIASSGFTGHFSTWVKKPWWYTEKALGSFSNNFFVASLEDAYI